VMLLVFVIVPYGSVALASVILIRVWPVSSSGSLTSRQRSCAGGLQTGAHHKKPVIRSPQCRCVRTWPWSRKRSTKNRLRLVRWADMPPRVMTQVRNASWLDQSSCLTKVNGSIKDAAYLVRTPVCGGVGNRTISLYISKAIRRSSATTSSFDVRVFFGGKDNSRCCIPFLDLVSDARVGAPRVSRCK
jgi:hypothetical protein